MKYILTILLAFFFTSCASLQNLTSAVSPMTNNVFKRDLRFTIDGQTFEGVAVLPAQSAYAVEVTPEKAFDLFTAGTCHREIDADQVSITKKRTFFGGSNKTSVRFTYMPRADLETGTSCGLEMGLFSAEDGQEYWAFIDFVETERYRIEAAIYCNGAFENTVNAGLCQSKVGTLQKISFQEEVVPLSDCLTLDSEDSKTFTFRAPLESCMAIFTRGDDIYRFTSFGYNQIKIKKYGG